MSKAAKTLDRILDGAIACYTRDGISKTSLDEVARAAGVGRTTLYRYVDNRDDLLAKVLLRDARLQQEELLILLRSHDNFASWLVDSMVHVMRARRTRPMNALLFGADSGGLLERISLEPANFYGVAEELLAPLFGANQLSKQRNSRHCGRVLFTDRIQLQVGAVHVSRETEQLAQKTAGRDIGGVFLDQFIRSGNRSQNPFWTPGRSRALFVDHRCLGWHIPQDED